MHLIAKVIRISHANFHCNIHTIVQDIQDYESLIFGTQCAMGYWILTLSLRRQPQRFCLWSRVTML